MFMLSIYVLYLLGKITALNSTSVRSALLLYPGSRSIHGIDDTILPACVCTQCKSSRRQRRKRLRVFVTVTSWRHSCWSVEARLVHFFLQHCAYCMTTEETIPPRSHHQPSVKVPECPANVCLKGSNTSMHAVALRGTLV